VQIRLFILPALLAALLAWDAALMVAPWRAGAAVQPIPEGPPTKRYASLPMPVDLAPTFPREGVDYVTTYAQGDGRHSPVGARITVFRHGALVHATTAFAGSAGAASGGFSSYSNLATAGSIIVYPDASGRPATATLRKRGEPDFPLYRHSVAPSGKSETIAGERCAEWIAKPETEGVSYSSCIARDGVVLRETTHARDGSVMTEARALKIERRAVTLAEVLPPAQILDWSYWTKAGVAPTEEAGARNYQIVMVGAGYTGNPATEIRRASAGWTSDDTYTSDGDRDLSVAGPVARFSFLSQEGELDFSRTGSRGHDLRPKHPSGIGFRPLIGEPCLWYRASGMGNWHEECRTLDNLPLLIRGYGEFVGSTHWEAVRLTRQQVPATAFTPPAWLMRWSYWGWPELDQTPVK
jgi:hypothetical protein